MILTIPDCFYSDQLFHRGTVGIRGRKALAIGPIDLVKESDSSKVTTIFATSVIIKCVRDITDGDASMEEFREASQYKRFLKNHYGNLDDTDNITIVRWDPHATRISSAETDTSIDTGLLQDS